MTRAAQTTRLNIALGLLFMAQLLIVCTVESARGNQAAVLWMSNVTLAIAGGGLLIGSRLLTAGALTAIAIPHGIWIADFTVQHVCGSRMLGLTSFLDHADAWKWLATAHHFYLVPILFVVVVRSGRYTFHALGCAAALLVIATMISRLALPPQLNVNWAFATLRDSQCPAINWHNALPATRYLLVHHAWVITFFMLPTAVLLRFMTRRAQADNAVAYCPMSSAHKSGFSRCRRSISATHR